MMLALRVTSKVWATVMLCLVPLSAYGFDPLEEPTLAPGQRVRREVGIINSAIVDRYTWRDASKRPRSVSLVRYGQVVNGRRQGGYAIQFTYQIPVAMAGPSQWRTVYINPPADRSDAGFGYFVSHELYRTFDAPVCPDDSTQCAIAHVHGEDDSPLGLNLPGRGTNIVLTGKRAIHAFTLNYPHWGTIDPIADPESMLTPSNPALHRKYDLPVTIHWEFIAGQNYPLWSVHYDLSGAGVNRLSIDLRGPYGVMVFDETDSVLRRVEWGDKYLFGTSGKGVTTNSAWTWNQPNAGARYNLLIAGLYEMGVVQNVPYATSTIGSGWTNDRNRTSAQGLGCPEAAWRLPCDWEWPYQSVQYEGLSTRMTRAKKLAWGTAPFFGTAKTAVWINATMTEPFAGYPAASYSVWITFDQSGGARTRTLAASITQTPTATAQRPFPQHLVYAPGTIRPNHRTQGQQDADVRAAYELWKANYLVSAGTGVDGSPRYRVAFGKPGTANYSKTVSEGQGFGMIIVALMAGYDAKAQTLFDGLWRYSRAYPSESDPRLMAWQIPFPIEGHSSAFDGDCDIAYALLLASRQWGDSGAINYRLEATARVLPGILASTIGPASRLPMLGDWVDPAGALYNQYTPRSSDFMPDHFRAFGQASGNPVWTDVLHASQGTIAQLQSNYSPATGLLPDFIVPVSAIDHRPQPAPPNFLEGPYDGSYSYNAGRDPWRIGTDALLHNDTVSLQQTRKLSTWIITAAANVPENIKAGYALNGTPLAGRDYFTSFFAAPFGVAAMTLPTQQQWLNDIYEAVRQRSEDYYEDSVTLLSLLVMTGNFWHPTP